jgi:hypothetical protein
MSSNGIAWSAGIDHAVGQERQLLPFFNGSKTLDLKNREQSAAMRRQGNQGKVRREGNWQGMARSPIGSNESCGPQVKRDPLEKRLSS